MSRPFTKDDLSFLAEAMDHKAAERSMSRSLTTTGVGAEDKVSGEISIPKPLDINVPGTMSEADYKACSTVMTVCQNMVQKTITDAARKAGIDATEALKNMNVWVQAYVDFPFPFFNFRDAQSDAFSKEDFSLKTDPDFVERVVNIKNVTGLKDAVLGALKKSGGELASYEKSDRNFNYFGVVTAFNEAEIAIRVVKFQMRLKNTVVKSLCINYEKTNLDTAYDTYQFVADKDMMIKMQKKMGDMMIEMFAEKLLEFVRSFYEEQLANFQDNIAQLLQPKPEPEPAA